MTQLVTVLCETIYQEQKCLLILFPPLFFARYFYSSWIFEIFFYFSLAAMTDSSDIPMRNRDNSSGAKQLKIIRRKIAMMKELFRILQKQQQNSQGNSTIALQGNFTGLE